MKDESIYFRFTVHNGKSNVVIFKNIKRIILLNNKHHHLISPILVSNSLIKSSFNRKATSDNVIRPNTFVRKPYKRLLLI